MLQTLEFCNVLILQRLPKSYAILCTFVASDPIPWDMMLRFIRSKPSRSRSTAKFDGITRRACDPILHDLLFFRLQRSLDIGDVFVAMLAYRKFFPDSV
jgi:hypothetical protein